MISFDIVRFSLFSQTELEDAGGGRNPSGGPAVRVEGGFSRLGGFRSLADPSSVCCSPCSQWKAGQQKQAQN